jgi:hypothetical protein
VQQVLKKPHVHGTVYKSRNSRIKPGEQLVIVVSYELGDDLVNDQVRAEAVAKIIKLVRREIGIKRLSPDEVARVKTFLQSDKGKSWRKYSREPIGLLRSEVLALTITSASLVQPFRHKKQ